MPPNKRYAIVFVHRLAKKPPDETAMRMMRISELSSEIVFGNVLRRDPGFTLS